MPNNDYIRTLCREYLELCATMRAGNLTDAEYNELSKQRTWTHNELIRLTGHDRPFDMQAYAQQQVTR